MTDSPVWVESSSAGIWISRGCQPATVLRVPPQVFATSCLDGVHNLYVLGSAKNAPVIEALRNASIAQSDVPQVWLGTPAIARASKHPEQTIANMRQLCRAASMGGWHEFSDRDYASYALVNELRRSAGRLTTLAQQLLHEHRAWPALSFIPGLDQTAAAGMLADIVDPRWFADQSKPNSWNKLYRFLGLTPKLVAGVLGALKEPADSWPRRAWLTNNCWFRPFSVSDLPGEFLFRVIARAPMNRRTHAYVIANRMFVRFVCSVWSHMLATQHRELFVPRYFFREAHVADAFQRHWEEFACWKSA